MPSATATGTSTRATQRAALVQRLALATTAPQRALAECMQRWRRLRRRCKGRPAAEVHAKFVALMLRASATNQCARLRPRAAIADLRALVRSAWERARAADDAAAAFSSLMFDVLSVLQQAAVPDDATLADVLSYRAAQKRKRDATTTFERALSLDERRAALQQHALHSNTNGKGGMSQLH